MIKEDFKDFTRTEKLCIIQLLIIILKGEQQDKKQNKIWEYLKTFELTFEDFEQHIKSISKDIFETTLQSIEKGKIDAIINLIHSLITSDPIAKTMEYFISIQIFSKITLTPVNYFIELLEKQGKTQLYPDFKILKNA